MDDYVLLHHFDAKIPPHGFNVPKPAIRGTLCEYRPILRGAYWHPQTDRQAVYMDSRNSPFALGWYASGSHRDFWGEDGTHTTYTLVPYGDLPILDRKRLNGSLAWIPDLPADDLALAFEDITFSPADRLARLAEEAARHRVSLPDSFMRFLCTPEIHCRVPTCTACYLDLSDRMIDAPGGAEGRLLRFMNDQQCCLLWYLHLRPGGEHAVLVGAPEWDDEAEGETLEDMVRLTEVLFCSPTFDDFILRFWLENTIWFSLHRARPMTQEQWEYLGAVRSIKARQATR